jgi:hypothetical protein
MTADVEGGLGPAEEDQFLPPFEGWMTLPPRRAPRGPLLLLSMPLNLHAGRTYRDAKVSCGTGQVALRPQRD